MAAGKYALSRSLDQYLGAILQIEKNASVARVKDIANVLGVKKGSVAGALKKLSAMGLIVYPSYRPVNLTDEGRRLAEYNRWRDSILMLFMTTVLHLSHREAEASVERIGYALGEKVVDRMRQFMAQTYEEVVDSLDFW